MFISTIISTFHLANTQETKSQQNCACQLHTDLTTFYTRQSNYIINSLQSAFQKHKNTETALILIKNDILVSSC